MFTKGQLVECIRSTKSGAIKRGAIYTIYWVGTGLDPVTLEPGDSVLVVEARPKAPAACFCAAYFRPLQDSKLDVFRAMLVQTPAPVFVHNGDDGA